jgi:ABC-type transport system substrate-binding protein
VRQEPGIKLEFEAFEGYYRPVHIKQLVMLAIPEATTRVAMLERQEADIIYAVPGELIDKVKSTRGVMLAPVLSASWFLEFPGFQETNNPFRDKRVREAVSLVIDRQAINQAETGGMGGPTGNWINNDVQYAIEWPEFERDVKRAKELMREAGYPNGFEVDWLTPLPTFYSRGERVIAQLRDIGIRAKLQVMERGIYLQRLQAGLRDWPGVQMIFHGVRIAGSWSFWYEAQMKCGGFNVRDAVHHGAGREVCAHESPSTQRNARSWLRTSSATFSNTIIWPVFRHAAVQAIGPRIAASAGGTSSSDATATPIRGRHRLKDDG